MSTFGEWIRQQREARHLTRKELSERVGISVAMLRKIETDERRPSVQIAELLANSFDVPPTDRATFIRIARGELLADRLSRGGGAAQTLTGQTAPERTDNLPVAPTPLIGRAGELAELRRLAEDPHCRLLSLVGPGGIGKTRLAIELAASLRARFADGVFFVPLASAGSARQIVPMMADALGFAFQAGGFAEPRVQLFNHLQDKKMVLLLDNLEQLLREPGVEVLAELLAAAPGILLVVTSREPLNLQAEWVFEVQGLVVPDERPGGQAAEDTSVELFVQRARRAHAGFDATTADYPAIVRICRLVEGAPLAIELAAAWVRTLTCSEIAAELEQGLDLLSAAARDLPARHRSMRAVFDHSWALLAQDEQQALMRLSLFRGGFGREAAEQVAGASLRMLSGLTAKSLVRRTGEGRYDLHELIRQYAADHLHADPAAEAEARQRHYDHYLALARESAEQLKGSSQLEWLRRLELEHDNLRAAMNGAIEAAREQPAKAEAALRLAGALRLFWQIGSHYAEGGGYLREALDRCPDRCAGADPQAALTEADAESCRDRARALNGLALLENALGHHAAASQLAAQSEAIARRLDDPQELGEAIIITGQTLRWRGERAAAHTLIQQALELFERSGDRWNTARALLHIGADLVDFSGDDAGHLKLEQSAAILDELGDRFISGRLMTARGIRAFTRGEYGTARARFTRALEIAREIRDPWGMADALTNNGCVLRVQGDYEAAHAHFVEGLHVYEHWGRGPWCADALCALAENEMCQGRLSSAASYLQQAASYVRAPENTWLHVLVTYFEGSLALYRGEAGRAAELLEQAAGLARLGQFQPDLARALATLARARRALGEVDQARLLTSEALALMAGSDWKLGIATTLETFAGLGPPDGAGRAARLLGTAQTIRTSIGAPLAPADLAEYTSTVTALEERLGAEEFMKLRECGQGEDYRQVAGEILAAFDAGRLPASDIAQPSKPPRPRKALGSS